MCKNFHLFTVSILIALIAITATELRADYICGDSNNDETVNVADAVWIINYVFAGGDPPNPMEAGDANCDGTCNIADAVWIINYIFAGGLDPCDPQGDGNPDCELNCPSTVVDRDGNIYQTIEIGDQCWMAENLKTTRYRNGDHIPHVTDAGEWSDLSTGAYCNYNNNEVYVAEYGRLYNWYAVVDSNNIAPEGWHVPTDAEWKKLEMYLGMCRFEADEDGSYRGNGEGGKLKEAGTAHWYSPNYGATNESGFTALPGGNRKGDGSFSNKGSFGLFWSASEAHYGIMAWYRCLSYADAGILRQSYGKGLGFSVRCVRDGVPVVITDSAFALTDSTAQCIATIEENCGYTVTARGVCWSTNPEPTIADNKTVEGSGTGSFTGSLTGLNPETTYYVRAYATNFAGTGYSGTKVITTVIVTDIDGNLYQTIKIGDQWWMAENLEVTHYRNGDPIPHVADFGIWYTLSTGAFCNYDNDEDNVPVYGRLYNWHAVDDERNIAPEGWHVPSDGEWQTLIDYLGGDAIAGGKMKEEGTAHWYAPNTGATNESGFTALPGGCRAVSFLDMSYYCYFWSSTEHDINQAWIQQLVSSSSVIYNSYYDKYFGLSVRCVRD